MGKLTKEEIEKIRQEERENLESLERKYGPEWARISVEIEELKKATLEDEIEEMRRKCGAVKGDPSELVDPSETTPSEIDIDFDK